MHKYRCHTFLLLPLIIFVMLTSNVSLSKGVSYSVGANRSIFMECSGEGLPVVMLLAGYPMRGDFAWNTALPGKKSPTVFSEVSKFTTVCTYDRPGTMLVKNDSLLMSRSTPVRQPVTVNDQVSDLDALIKAANIPKPFIIVAHSAGGLIARMYAFSHPKDLIGVILLDVTTEDLKDKWNRKEWTIFDYSMNVLTDEQLYQHDELEWLDMDVSFYQMQKAMGKGEHRVKLEIPHAIVMTADKKPNAAEIVKLGMWPNWATQKMADEIIQKVLKSQDELAGSFDPVAKHITNTNSGHNIQQEQPQLVIDEIRAMVESSRGK